MADPALHIAVEEESSQRPVSHLRIDKGVMILTRQQRETRPYTIRNTDKTSRQLVLEHPARDGWTLPTMALSRRRPAPRSSASASTSRPELPSTRSSWSTAPKILS